MKRGWIPLAAGFVVVPAVLTTLGFAVYGEELADGLPSSAAMETITTRGVAQPGPPVDWAKLEEQPPAPAPPTPDVLQRRVTGVFSEHAVRGITFAPGTSDLVGRGEAVQRAVGGVLGSAAGTAITLVAHAWNGETLSHRCDVLAMHRAGLVKQYLVAQGVPDSAISTKVIVDPVWGPPSDDGPQVDVVVR